MGSDSKVKRRASRTLQILLICAALTVGPVPSLRRVSGQTAPVTFATISVETVGPDGLSVQIAAVPPGYVAATCPSTPSAPCTLTGTFTCPVLPSTIFLTWQRELNSAGHNHDGDGNLLENRGTWSPSSGPSPLTTT